MTSLNFFQLIKVEELTFQMNESKSLQPNVQPQHIWLISWHTYTWMDTHVYITMVLRALNTGCQVHYGANLSSKWVIPL